MTRIYVEAAFMAVIIGFMLITGWHSFHVSEQAREDDMSINRYVGD